MKTRNDCEIACDCVKRANVVLHVDLCKEIFDRRHTGTHKPTTAQPTHCATMTHTHTHTHIHTYTHTPRRSLVAVKPRRPPKTNVDTETAFRHDHCKTHIHIQKVNISEVRGQLKRSNSEVRVHAGAKFGHTGC